MDVTEAKTYIGDGVYAEDDGMGVWLTTERANGEHRIYLEPEMLAALTEWLRRRHLALIHSEVSEALQAFRVADGAHFIEELADIIIRVFDCAEGLGADMDAAVEAKLAKNRQRGYRHGGKRV